MQDLIPIKNIWPDGIFKVGNKFSKSFRFSDINYLVASREDKESIAILNLPPRPMMGIESCGMLISAVHTEEGEEKLHLLMVDPHIPAGAKLY